jgi:dynein heavy chain
VKSDEVRRACDDLVEMIAVFPRDNTQEMRVKVDAVANFKAHYARLTYSAVLHATRQTIAVLKARLGSRTSGGFLFLERPFFDVNVELSVPYVMLNPPLEDVQRAVNGVAKKVLKASLEITRWGNTDLNGDEENVPGVDYDMIGTASFYDEIASDIEIVKLVLLLTVRGLSPSAHLWRTTLMSHTLGVSRSTQKSKCVFEAS